MRIDLTSVDVDDQRAALDFYVDALGFTPHRDVPIGEDSWPTVVSPDAADGSEAIGSVRTTALTLQDERWAPKRRSQMRLLTWACGLASPESGVSSLRSSARTWSRTGRAIIGTACPKNRALSAAACRGPAG